MRDRAFRRWKEVSKKKQARKFGYNSSLSAEDLTPARIGKSAHTPKPCSNPDCCGNPRRSQYAGYQRKLQEMRAEADFEEQLTEFDNEN